MNNKIWRMKEKLIGFIRNDRKLGVVRLIFIVLFTFAFIWLGFYFFENVDTSAIEETVSEDGFYVIPKTMIVSWIRFSQTILYGFRHAIIPVGMFIGVLLASAFYVQDVYELTSLGSAFHHIFSSFVGVLYPKVTIIDGKFQLGRGETNLLDAIGGPGFINIRPGNVALIESLRAPAKVLSNGYHFISRFETIRDIVNLDDQHGFIEKLQTKVRSKDGIQVVVRDIHYRYRLRTGHRFGDHEKRKAADPYPFSVQAVKDMSYNRSARRTGLTDWHSTIQLAVDGAITDYIKEHNFDQLTAPGHGDDPRAEINKKLIGPGVRTRMRNWGAELLWVDIGHFDVIEIIDDLEVKKTIEKQRIETWSARWDGNAMIVKAAGEGQQLAAQDIGRAEGQSEMLISILQALNEIDVNTEEGQNENRAKMLRGIVWSRVAQIFDRIADEERKNDD